MTIATGAQQSIVRANLVKEEEYLSRTVHLVGFNGASVEAPMARVWLSVRYTTRSVCKEAPEPVLLGLDVRFLDYLLDLEREQRKKSSG